MSKDADIEYLELAQSNSPEGYYKKKYSEIKELGA